MGLSARVLKSGGGLIGGEIRYTLLFYKNIKA